MSDKTPTPSPARDHLPGCPRLQFWDGGDSVPCTCDDSPTPSLLAASLAREARLREVLEECANDLESVAAELEGGEDQKLSPPEHWRKCADLARHASLSPSPLAEAAAEVLEAVDVEYNSPVMELCRQCEQDEVLAISIESHDATMDRYHRYRSLLREEQEGGGR